MGVSSQSHATVNPVFLLLFAQSLKVQELIKKGLRNLKHFSQLSGVQNGPAQEYKKTIPDKLTLLGNLLGQNKAILDKKEKFHESSCQI